MSEMSDDLAKVAQPVQPREDKLQALRFIVRAHHDLCNRILDIEEQLNQAKKAKLEMEMRTLPDLFHEAAVDRVGIPEDGNHPAYDAVLTPYYHANIPPEYREEAFSWLEDHGHGDLIKTTVKVELGRGQREKAKEVESMLQKLGIDYSRDLGVPWNTLTAWLKEQIHKQKPLPPLTTIGASVGNIVKLKERKL